MSRKKEALLTMKRSSALRAALLKKYSGACAACGTKEPFLELAALNIAQSGVDGSLDDFLLLCPNCHSLLDRAQPKELEFSDFLVELLENSAGFRNVTRERLLSDKRHARADIVAEERRLNSWAPTLIECKASRFLDSYHVRSAIRQIKDYQSQSGISKAALALPGRVLPEDAALLKAANIDLWDRAYISDKFRTAISKSKSTFFRILFASHPNVIGNESAGALLAKLASCASGKESWSIYQNLVRDIFEMLFTPPLDKPMSETSDTEGVNRRDIIIPNHATEGFWRHLRESYHADYIVIDAKNYKSSFKKSEVLQVSNYLKAHGAGLFALIVSRSGADRGALLTIREQWVAHRKLVVPLTDNDVRSMLMAKIADGSPEQIISDRIKEFRLSM